MSRVFQTSDQGLAAFLCCQGFTFLGAVRTDDPNRMDFVFVNEGVTLSPDRREREARSLQNQIEDARRQRTIENSMSLYVNGEGWSRAKQFQSKMRLVRQALRNPISAGDA